MPGRARNLNGLSRPKSGLATLGPEVKGAILGLFLHYLESMLAFLAGKGRGASLTSFSAPFKAAGGFYHFALLTSFSAPFKAAGGVLPLCLARCP